MYSKFVYSKLLHMDACTFIFLCLAMLEWFVSKSSVVKAMNEGLPLSEDEIEFRPMMLPSTCIDENINISRIRKYFTDLSWSKVLQAIESKRSMKYYCLVCECDLEEEEGSLSICCDGCLQWAHLCCAGLKAVPTQKEWFCYLCRSSVHAEHQCSRGGVSIHKRFSKQDNKKSKLNRSPAVATDSCITVSSDEGSQSDKEEAFNVTSGSRVLYSDFDILKNPNGWLNRRLVNAGQDLLKKKFPQFGGFQDVGKMQTNTFEQEDGEFIQVLHCYESHWVLVTNKDCKEKQVMVYDSNRSGDVSLDTKRAIASMIRTPHSYFFLTFQDVQQQDGGSCCGLFSLAFAYSLCSGIGPAKIVYKQTEFCNHFLQCLKNRAIDKFPQEDIMKVPGKAILWRVNVFCLCRLPDGGDPMIRCSKCSKPFHRSCVTFDDTTSYVWFCSICTCASGIR